MEEVVKLVVKANEVIEEVKEAQEKVKEENLEKPVVSEEPEEPDKRYEAVKEETRQPRRYRRRNTRKYWPLCIFDMLLIGHFLRFCSLETFQILTKNPFAS